MTDTPWTKGNWTVRHDADFLQIGVEGDKDVLCCLGLSPAPDWPAKEAAETTANARLISAAPDMAEALERAILTLGYVVNNPSAWQHFDQDLSDSIEANVNAFRAALAKARGT